MLIRPFRKGRLIGRLKERRARQKDWHPWFAWKPVWLCDMEVWAIGQWVFRRADPVYVGHFWKYCGDTRSKKANER
jgi:hypothetical protein